MKEVEEQFQEADLSFFKYSSQKSALHHKEEQRHHFRIIFYKSGFETNTQGFETLRTMLSYFLFQF